LIFLLRPEIYESMEKQNDNTAEVEMVGLKEVQDQHGRTQLDMSQEEFKLLVKAKTERIYNPQVISRTSEGTVELGESPYANPIEITRI